jgi:hypothetical protein
MAGGVSASPGYSIISAGSMTDAHGITAAQLAKSLRSPIVPLRAFWAIVQAVEIGSPSTLQITLGASSVIVAGVAFFSGYLNPTPGDKVLVLDLGKGDLFVLGDPFTTLGQAAGDIDVLTVPMSIPTDSPNFDPNTALVVDSTGMTAPTQTLEVVGEGTSGTGGSAGNANLLSAVTAPGFNFGWWVLNYGAAFLQFSPDANPVVFGMDGPTGGPDLDGGFFSIEQSAAGPVTGQIQAGIKFTNVSGRTLGLLMAGGSAPEAGSAWLPRPSAFYLRWDGPPWIYQTSDAGNSWTSIL